MFKLPLRLHVLLALALAILVAALADVPVGRTHNAGVSGFLGQPFLWIGRTAFGMQTPASVTTTETSNGPISMSRSFGYTSGCRVNAWQAVKMNGGLDAAAGDLTGSATITTDFALEYPIGSSYQLATWNGSPAVSIPPGAMAFSDVMSAKSIPELTEVGLRTSDTISSGVSYLSSSTLEVNSTMEQGLVGTSASQTAGTGAFNTTGLSAPTVPEGPSITAVIGYGTSECGGIMLGGDSVLTGTGETYGDGQFGDGFGGLGMWQRGMLDPSTNTPHPYLIMGVGGYTAADAAASSFFWALVPYTPTVILSIGHDDFSSIATVESNLVASWAKCRAAGKIDRKQVGCQHLYQSAILFTPATPTTGVQCTPMPSCSTQQLSGGWQQWDLGAYHCDSTDLPADCNFWASDVTRFIISEVGVSGGVDGWVDVNNCKGTNQVGNDTKCGYGDPQYPPYVYTNSTPNWAINTVDGHPSTNAAIRGMGAIRMVLPPMR